MCCQNIIHRFFEKHKLCIVSSLCFSIWGACQFNTQAHSAQAQLAHRYPKAQNISWDSTENGLIAEFSEGALTGEATFDLMGRFKSTNFFITETDLPAALRKTIADKFPYAETTAVVLTEYADNRIYQLELLTATEYVNLTADTKGNILSENKKPLSEKEMENLEEEGVDDEGDE